MDQKGLKIENTIQNVTVKKTDDSLNGCSWKAKNSEGKHDEKYMKSIIYILNMCNSELSEFSSIAVFIMTETKTVKGFSFFKKVSCLSYL